MTDVVPPLLPPPTSREPECQIVVPSYGRPGHVLTAKMLEPENFIVLVGEDQVELYRDAQPELQIEPYPLPERDFSRKLQWIYDRWGDVICLDDDLDRMEHMEHIAGEGRCWLTKAEAMEVFRMTARDACEAGVYLFGWGDGDPRNFDDMHPIRRVGVVGGSMGLLAGSKLSFNSEIRVSSDYWIAGLNAYWHRTTWIDWRFVPNGPPTTFKGAGGIASVRSMAVEEADYKVLKRYFGDAIVKKEKTLRAGLTHPWQRRLELPYG
jgi:hypothetical protein